MTEPRKSTTNPAAATLPPRAEAVTLTPAPTPPAHVAPAVPGYEIVRELGRGGMGVVYEARQVGLNRQVALKMILAGGHASATDLDRFRTEAEAVARLQHPNIVQVYETGTHSGLPYFSLEFCPGGSLDRKLDGTPWEPAPTAALVEILARAIQHAHDHGIVHRDLKPANVLLAADGTPKVTDFGLAKRLDRAVGLTQSGAILGTPSYMAPEQAGAGHPVGPPADMYALGAILYELLTGRPPFKAATQLDTVLQVVSDDPVPPTRLNPKTPRDLETIALKCLAKDPVKRYASAAALAEDLRRFQASEPITARPVGRLERGWRWCRRKPALAGSLAAAVLALVSGAAASTAFGVWASHNAERAEQEAKVAEVNADLARDEKLTAQRYLYGARMNLIQMAWEANDFVRVRDLLEATTQPGQADLRRFEWHYWDRLCDKHFRTMAGHFMAYSPDGRWLAGSRPDGSVRVGTVTVWDAETGQAIWTLPGHTGVISNVAFSPDGRWLASGSFDKTVRVWDARSGHPVRTMTGHTDQVLCIAYSLDGRWLASGSYDKTVRVWDTATGQPVRVLPGHADEVRSVAYSPDGQHLATGARDGVRIWDTTTWQELPRLRGRNRLVTSVAYSPNGQRLVAGTMFLGGPGTTTVVVWDVRTGQELLAPTGHSEVVNTVAYSPDGRWLASGSQDGSVRVWDAETGRPMRTLPRNGIVGRVAFSPDGQWLACGSSGIIKLWKTAMNQELLSWKEEAHAVTYSPDGRRLASGGLDQRAVPVQTLKVWDAETGQMMRTLPGHTSTVGTVAYSPDGRWLASGSLDTTVKVWDATTGQLLRTLLPGQSKFVQSVTFSRDGRWLASGSQDGSLKVWDAATGQVKWTLPGPGHPELSNVAFSPDGRWLASGLDKTVSVWDAATGQLVRTLPGHTGVISNVAFSPDGRRLASGSSDETVKVWEAETGWEIRTLQGHTSGILRMAYSSDGDRLASGSFDGTVKVWDAITGQELLTFPGHVGWVRSLAYSPDGRRLASCGNDGTIKIWGAFEHEKRAAPETRK
jgi:WD40 repeat protein